MENKTTKNRINSLDSLRGIASLIVVLFHCVTCYVIFLNANFGNPKDGLMEYLTFTPLKLLWAGNEAVLVFFVLSGFVLSLPFIKGYQIPYMTYIIKRFFRIYIPYIILMAISAILATLFMQYKTDLGLSAIYVNRWNHDIDLNAIIAYILMINYDTANVNGVVWSLFHEMRISIVFPLIALIIIKFDFIKAFIITYGIIFIGYLGLGSLKETISDAKLALIVGDFSLTFFYAIFFVAGSFLAKYIHLFNIRKWYVNLILFIMAILLINVKPLYLIGIKDMKDQYIVCLVGIILLFIVILNSKLADRILNVKPLVWLGKVSYSLYLVHVPLIMLSTIFLTDYIGLEMAFLVAAITSVGVAGIAHKYVEQPAIRWGKSISTLFAKAK